jgi:hypothetical protein
MITIFSAPKAFEDEHISKIQHNALRSWLTLNEDIEVILLGDEHGLKEVAAAFGVRCIPVKSRSISGAPLIDELFALARQHAKFSTICYLNADIILMEDFLPSVQVVMQRFPSFLIVGNRYDLEIHDELQIQNDWREDLRRMVNDKGKLHPPMGSDFFIFQKDQFADMPSFILGRAGWDNWMMFKARHSNIPLVDASAAITAIHQDHDYAHLPGGEPHYRHPESNHNIKLAGGLETIFRLRDANWVITQEGIRKKKMAEWEWPRKIEADLIAAFGSGIRSRLTRMIFHPLDTLVYFQHKVFGENRTQTEENSLEREDSA